MSSQQPRLPLSEGEVEAIVKSRPMVIRLEELKPIPIRQRRIPGIEALAREASRQCIKGNRELCMRLARGILLTVTPSEVGRALREAVEAGVQYEVALAYIAHAVRRCVVVARIEDAGDSPCIIHKGTLLINTKPLLNGEYTIRDASSEFGPITEPSPQPSLLERLTSLLRRWVT